MKYDKYMDQANFINNVKAISADQRIMHKELAEAGGITRQCLTIYFDVKRKRSIPMTVASAIANRLGYKLSTLLTLKSK